MSFSWATPYEPKSALSKWFDTDLRWWLVNGAVARLSVPAQHQRFLELRVSQGFS